MDISAILPDEELVFEGDGEAIRQMVGSVVQNHHNGDSVNSHVIRSDTDDSSDSLEDEMENSGDIGIDAVTCPQPLCCSSPIKSYGFNPSMPEFLLLSSSRDPSGFEGNGKGENNDNSIMDPIVLSNEVAELRFQNRKLLETVQELRSQNAAYDDNQNSLLEDLERKKGQCKGHSEKLKQLQREVEEAKNNLQRYEDANVIYSKRIQRLEKDNAALAEESESLRAKMTILSSESDRFRLLFRESEQRVNTMESFSNDRINELIVSKEEAEEQLKLIKSSMEEMIKVNELLRLENIELENNLAAAQESYLESKLASLDASVTRGDITFDDEEDLISFRASSCTPVHNSLHAEIAASLRRDSCDLPQFRHDSLITLKTSDGSLPWDLESPEFSHRVLSVLTEILDELQQVRLELPLEDLQTSSRKEEKDQGVEVETENKETDGPGLTAVHSSKESETIEQVAAVGDLSQVPETPPKEVDVVRRIHEELAEFRAQLKKSQDFFHAFNTGQTYNVTKSCPLLADDTDTDTSPTNVLKSHFVTISTQTEAPPVIPSSSQTNSISSSRLPILPVDKTDSCADTEGLSCLINNLTLDDNELDKLSLDDDSYRLTINLPTVLEESEQETETSPATLPRRMSSEKNKRRLTRLPPMDEPIRSGDESEFYSAPSTLPSSKNTSTYNSLERPLQISGGSANNPDDDYQHIPSDSSTTYNSPISSPSYYWTPSQGSSEETIANHDGDRTPVNESIFDDDTINCRPDLLDSTRSPSTGLKRRPKPIKNLELLIDDRSNSVYKGVIDESDKERLTSFAFDVVARSTNPQASILDRQEWRILKQDLRKKVVSQFNKGVAQEEGTDNDNMAEGDPVSGVTPDLDDEAEQCIFETSFPDMVERLFESLDRCKIKDRQDFTPLERDHDEIRERFSELSNVFITDHGTLNLRADQSNKEMKNVETRIDEILKSLKSSAESLRNNLDSYDKQDIIDILHKMEQNSLELESNSKRLTKKAKEVGSVDLEKRVYKLIDVMVLYVHILRNYEIPDKDPVSAKNPARGDGEVSAVPVVKNPNGSIPSSNNNNDEKGSWTGGYLGEGQRMERWFVAGSEFIRRELSWPWNWEQTWKGVKQCFSILLMLTALLIIFKSVFPIVSADGSYCNGQPMNPVASLLSKQASLVHEQLPTL